MPQSFTKTKPRKKGLEKKIVKIDKENLELFEVEESVTELIVKNYDHIELITDDIKKTIDVTEVEPNSIDVIDLRMPKLPTNLRSIEVDMTDRTGRIGIREHVECLYLKGSLNNLKGLNLLGLFSKLDLSDCTDFEPTQQLFANLEFLKKTKVITYPNNFNYSLMLIKNHLSGIRA